jgi:hypothetical protein
MKTVASATIIFRIAALLLLLVAAGQVYACDKFDACLTVGPDGSADDCDQPSGDNCVCCCHHVVPPLSPFSLQLGDPVYQKAAPAPKSHELTRSRTIDHPPQL